MAVAAVTETGAAAQAFYAQVRLIRSTRIKAAFNEWSRISSVAGSRQCITIAPADALKRAAELGR